MRTSLLVLVALSSLALVGCSAAGAPPVLPAEKPQAAPAAVYSSVGVSLVGSWKAMSLHWGDDGSAAGAPTAAADLTFTTDGAISGTTSCATFSGNYTITANVTRLADLVFDEQGCSPGHEPGDDARLRGALDEPLSLSVTDGVLGFYSPAKRLVAFYEPVDA